MKRAFCWLITCLLCLAGCQGGPHHAAAPGAGGGCGMPETGLTDSSGTQVINPPKFAAGAPKSQLLPQQPGLPAPAYTGYPGDGYTRPGNIPQFMQPGGGDCTPLPLSTFGPWRPPGIGGTWPPDEYICDGGGSPQTTVHADFTIEGMKPEDAIGHFDTIDGKTIVQPTNKVCIYAPRFAAVRKVDLPFGGEQLQGPNKILLGQAPHQADEANLAVTAMQPVEAQGAIEDLRGIALERRQPGITVYNRVVFGTVESPLKPYEDFLYIRSGVLQEEDKPILAQRIQAAIQWTGDQAVQVEINGRRATPLVKHEKAAEVYEVNVPNHPKLQICKIASTDSAKPGDIVYFTIRFDNVGDQKMGNVTVADNLTARLEYVPGSSESSLKTEFSSQPNEVGSQFLRWEIIDPLATGQGGIIRFQCKVR